MYSSLKWPSGSSIVKLINDMENDVVSSRKNKNDSTDEDNFSIISIKYEEELGTTDSAGSDHCSSTARTRGNDHDSDDTLNQCLLGWPLFISYGVGHVFNDMIASMWFSYALVYYQYVIVMSSFHAGTVLLIGQLTDAVATASIGVISDNVDNYFTNRYGRRKTWHLLGSIFVFASLPFAFSPPIFSEISNTELLKVLYYSFFIVFFQIGWACIENSHLTLVSDLTPFKNERTALLSIRYSFTVFSNIFVYIITWIVLKYTGAHEETYGPTHKGQFQIVVMAIMIVGSITTIIFHLGVHEPLVNNHEDRELLMAEPDSRRAYNSIWSIFKCLPLYQTAFVYMLSRITVNTTSVFLPEYLQNYLQTKSEKLALLPLIMFLSSFGMSFFNTSMNVKIGRKCTYLFGVVMAVGAAEWCFIGNNGQTFIDYQIYGVIILIGIACSVILVTSQAYTTDFIGSKTHLGALIFGIMSFTDKVSNGVVIAVVQTLYNEQNQNYYRNIMIFIWTIPSCLAFIAIMLLPYDRRPNKSTPKPNTSYDYESVKQQETASIMVESACYS